MKAAIVLLLAVSAFAIDNHAIEPKTQPNKDKVSIQPDGGEFGDLGSLFADLLQDEQLSSMLGGVMGGLGGPGVAKLMQTISDPDAMMGHAEKVLGTNPLDLLEKFGDPALMEDMMSNIQDHELFQHLENGDYLKVMSKMMDPNYMQQMAKDFHEDPKVKAMVEKITHDPQIQTVINKVASGESMDHVTELIESSGLAQMMEGLTDKAANLDNLDIPGLLGKLGGAGGMEGVLSEVMGGADVTKIMGELFEGHDGGEMAGILQGLMGGQGDMGKVLGSLMGGNGDIGQMMGMLGGLMGGMPQQQQQQQQKEEAIPDLHKFASLVDTLGGLDKVVDMMKGMGMEDMLEKAGGVEALQNIIDDSKTK